MPAVMRNWVVAAVLAIGPALAAMPEAQEARYLALLEQLRCLVCQNQTLAESGADLAGDLRRQVLEMIENGSSDEQILSFMTDRYGDFVLYRPPFKPRTFLLWAAPLLLLIAFLAALLGYVAARAQRAAGIPPEASSGEPPGEGE